MRKIALQLICILTVLAVALPFANAQGRKTEGFKLESWNPAAFSAPPPSSLDKLYPPKAEQPVYLVKMLELNSSFVGIVADLLEGDTKNARADFERFKAQYVEISKIVPEWEKNYPMGPVEELGRALKSGAQGEVLAAHEKLGGLCFDCHVATMPSVQQRYHWRDFDTIRVKDPVTNEEVVYLQLMLHLDESIVGILLDFEQGQRENAQKQLQRFKARFQALRGVCAFCHETERKYFVDEDARVLLDKLGRALDDPSATPKTVGAIWMRFGMDSCFKCHLVHFPAAAAKARWAKWEKMKGK